MKNHQHSRLLTTVVLVAALSFALGSEALAAGGRSPMAGPAMSGRVFRPGSMPMSGTGDPDQSGGNAPAPIVKPARYRDASGTTEWAMRLHWSFRMLLVQLPRRFR